MSGCVCINNNKKEKKKRNRRKCQLFNCLDSTLEAIYLVCMYVGVSVRLRVCVGGGFVDTFWFHFQKRASHSP